MTVILTGEVIEELPSEVESKVVALRTLDGDSQAAAVTVMLSHSRTGLLAAIAAQDLPQIVEWKAKASAIAEVTKQLRLGKDMQLDAAEFVRRAERGLGVAIRKGQARGEIIARGTNPGNQYTSEEDRITAFSKIARPTEFATPTELSGNSGDGIYAMTDNVTDEQFEEAVTEAKGEGNLSRANVARKAKSKAHPEKEVINANDPLIDAGVAPQVRPFKKSDMEMLAEIAGTLENFADLITWIRPEYLSDAAELIEQARTAWRAINKHLKEMESNV